MAKTFSQAYIDGGRGYGNECMLEKHPEWGGCCCICEYHIADGSHPDTDGGRFGETRGWICTAFFMLGYEHVMYSGWPDHGMCELFWPKETLSLEKKPKKDAIVYLAGPISGISYEKAVGWRRIATQRLAPIRCLSPMRGKTYLSSEEAIADSYDTPLSCARGILTRDHWDVLRCGVVLANLLGAERVSVGTVCEIAWAHAYRKPVVLVMEPNGNPHQHAMIVEMAGFWLQTLDEAIDVVKTLVGD